MMRWAVLALLPLCALAAADAGGMMHVKSKHSVADTVARGKQMMRYHDLEVLAEIDYAARAAELKQQLPPSRLLVFGDTETELVLLRDERLTGLDLPLRLFVWEDEKGTVWISYVSPEYFALRHGLAADSPPLRRLAELLGSLGRALAN